MRFAPKTLSFLTALLVALPLAGCSKRGTIKSTKGPDHLLASDGKRTEDPELVELEAATANRFVPADQASDLLVRLRVSADAIPDAPRPPINVMLVVDTSGSMEGEAITDAREAASALVDHLEPGDQFGMVVFHSKAELLVPSTKIEQENLDSIRQQVQQMRASGTTDLAGGLSQALNEMAGAVVPDGINRIVLLSDGVPNDASQVHNLAQSARNHGIAVTALGLGLEYDETLLSNVAQLSGGNFHFVESSTEVAAVFRDEVLRLERIAAANTLLTLRPGPGVNITEVIGHPFSLAGDRSASVPLGEIAEGEDRDVFVRLHVGSHVDQAPVELMDAVVQFDDTVNGSGRQERSKYIAARSTKNGAELESGRVSAIELSSERARAAAAIVQAIAMSRAGQLHQARQLIDETEPRVRAAAERLEDDELSSQAEEMVELRKALPAVTPAPSPAPTPIAVDDVPGAGGPGSAPQPFPESAPSTVRRSHDRAMRKLQGR